MNDRDSRPVVIIGAPRSGTNLLRDLICQVQGFGTWPCDEINLLWRHGNAGHPDDALPAECATPAVISHMRRRFAEIARARRVQTVVEKTCANSLRVAFVDRILPDARFVLIIRDGRDAAASAVERSRAPIDWRYTLRKLRYVPATDLPYYALQYSAGRATRFLRADRRLAFWGPRFAGFAEFARSATIAELCARQWSECVELATRDLESVGRDRVHALRYEELVRHPRESLAAVLAFLGRPGAAMSVEVSHVTSSGIGRGAGRLQAADGRAMELMAPSLRRLGYA